MRARGEEVGGSRGSDCERGSLLTRNKDRSSSARRRYHRKRRKKFERVRGKKRIDEEKTVSPVYNYSENNCRTEPLIMPWKNFNYPHWLEQNRLTSRQMLQPLFEAVENAFNAIEEIKKLDGAVRIQIHRDLQQKTIKFDAEGKRIGTPSNPISIEVTDNGAGFTKVNWLAFEEIFTPRKHDIGGKGMGRLTYLLAFEEALIDSCFQENKEFFQRRFSMSRIKEGTSMDLLERAETASDSLTTLTLNNPDHRFCDCFPKKLETLAGYFVVHFFRRLSRPEGTECFLCDDWDGSEIDLRSYCRDKFILKQASEQISILGRDYQVTHVRAHKRTANHHDVLFCGNGRVVCAKELPNTFCVTRDALSSEGTEFYYAAFVESEVLDQATRTDRMSLNLEEKESEDQLYPENGDSPSLNKLVNEIGARARMYLHDVLGPLEGNHKRRVVEYCKKNVVYRPLLKHRMDPLLNIQVGLSEEEFEAAVSRIYFEWKSDVRARFRQMARTVQQNTAELGEWRTGYQEILSTMSELAFHELAGYVMDRKAVVDFLWSKLKMSPEGKFAVEDQIHDIFFPRRQTSFDLAWDESNLWLIDERLAYQQFVASDLEFSVQGLEDSDSKERPDLSIYYDRFYDLTFAFAEGELPFTSVTLVEFKRPERKEYSHEHNPVEQVMRYIAEIRGKKALTNDRHTFRIREDTPIHVHVICHLVAELMPYLDRHAYVMSPDGEGLVFYAPKLNTMVQFTTFEKIVADAKKRNEVFFRKLGVDDIPA